MSSATYFSRHIFLKSFFFSMRAKTTKWVQYVFVVLSPSRGKRLSSKVEVANLLGTQLQCRGHERHFLDCPSDFTSINGQTLTECPDRDSLVLMCNPGALMDIDTGKINNIRGFPYVSIDLQVKSRPNRNKDRPLGVRTRDPKIFSSGPFLRYPAILNGFEFHRVQ